MSEEEEEFNFDEIILNSNFNLQTDTNAETEIGEFSANKKIQLETSNLNEKEVIQTNLKAEEGYNKEQQKRKKESEKVKAKKSKLKVSSIKKKGKKAKSKEKVISKVIEDIEELKQTDQHISLSEEHEREENISDNQQNDVFKETEIIVDDNNNNKKKKKKEKKVSKDDKGTKQKKTDTIKAVTNAIEKGKKSPLITTAIGEKKEAAKSKQGKAKDNVKQNESEFKEIVFNYMKEVNIYLF